MKTDALIDGLKILQPYYDKPNGWNVGAEHDVIYAYATDDPVSPADIEKLIELGWFQEDAPRDASGDYTAANYVQDMAWTAYV